MALEHLAHHLIEKNEIPGTENINRLVLLWKDPEWLYAYWEIDEQERVRLKQYIDPQKRGNFTWVIRLISIHNSNYNPHIFYIDVSDDEKNKYIYSNQSNIQVKVEYGLLGKDYYFMPLLASNTVMVPQRQQGKSEQPLFVDIKTNMDKNWDWKQYHSQTHFTHHALTSSEAYYHDEK